MAEEVSPESKLYVKEEIERIKKEFKEDLKEAQSKSTRIFGTIVLIVGLVTGFGVYYPAREYLKSIVETKLDADTAEKIKADVQKLSDLKTELEKHQIAGQEGFAWIGGIKFIWGSGKSTDNNPQRFEFKPEGFSKECFAVIPSMAGRIDGKDLSGFSFDRQPDYPLRDSFTFYYVAIGQ